MSLAAFTQYFDQIQDPRQATKVTYTLFDVLFLTVAAVIGGSQGWEEIEDFGHCHLDWLKQHGDYSQGIPALLKLLDIKGCLVSIDAMGCQTAIATTIIEQNGDYLLAVKGNQKNLYLAIQAALSASLAEPSKALIEQQHGRI